MIGQSVDQAVLSCGHRPMSLLLQALKQIESKAPGEIAFSSSSADDDAVRYDGHGAPASEGETPCLSNVSSAVGSLASVEAEPCVAQTAIAASGLSISVARQYGEAEAVSEIALAGPLELPIVSLVTPLEAPPAPHRRPLRHTCRLGGDVVGLLPDDSRAVIALVSFDKAMAAPLSHEVCAGLAALELGEVLAITDGEPGPLTPHTGGPSLSEVAANRISWQAAIVRGPHCQHSTLPRGGVQALQRISRRRLLAIWQELGEQFAYVVVEICAADLNQSLSVLATCDAAFIALRLNETRRTDIEGLAAQIRSSGCHLCGCLVL